MKAREIRGRVSPITVCMASALIREGRMAITREAGQGETGCGPCDMPEVQTAVAALHLLLGPLTGAGIMEVTGALLSMPQDMDGVRNTGNYFNRYVLELEQAMSAESS